MTRRLILAGLLSFATAAGAQSHTYLDPALRGSSAQPVRKVLIVPADVVVSEISAGGVIEKVADWSKQGTGNIAAAISRTVPQKSTTALAEMPKLSGTDQSNLEQHLALYDVVAGNIQNLRFIGGQAWESRVNAGDVDLSLGPGLAFLADKTGADTALVVMVRDYISSADRKAMMIAGALFGVVIPMGRTFAAAALVDLKTGRVLWQAFDSSATPDVRVSADADKVVADLFQSFPLGAAEKTGQ